MTGIYLHIPFCASRCIYCGFYSSTLLSMRDRYADALCREMQLRPCQDEVATIYFGGGTPSQLTSEQLTRVLQQIYENYRVRDDAEVTVEMNPDDVPVLLAQGALPGVNRVSMGVQTFSDERLQLIHRRHSAAQVTTAVQALRKAGISNISIDLMFGFPGETFDDWKADVEAALQLDVPHISAYSLMYEEGTALYRMLEQGKVKEIDEELSLQMYDYLVHRLEEAGYEHYEISNFARPGFRSRHNSSYWHEVPYIGLGAAAHSMQPCEDKTGQEVYERLWNVSDVRRYVESVEAGERPSEHEMVDASTRYDDLITTALRTCEGIDVDLLAEPYRSYLLRQAQPYIDRGLLRMTPAGEGRGRSLVLTLEGIHVSNTVMADLMYV